MATLISDEQHQLLNITSGIAAGLSLCCATYMIWTILRSKYYRSRMYHRIMLGMSFNIIIMVVVKFWEIANLKDNQAACAAVGFLRYNTVMITPLYYGVLSILCYMAVRKKFEYHSIVWIEKYLHCVVVLTPFAIACYLLSVEGFNYLFSGCHVASIPEGCGSKSGEVCTRGPQNIRELRLIFLTIPGVLFLLTPAAVMVLLGIHISRQDNVHRGVTLSVIKQGAAYLLVLLAIYAIRLYQMFTLVFGDNSGLNSTITILASTNEGLVGVWVLLSYLYFRTNKRNQSSSGNTNTVTDINVRGSSSRKTSLNISENLPEVTDNTETAERMHRNRSSFFLKKPEFSIFDGTEVVSDSPWAKFLTEGVDEEYEEGKVWQQ